MEIDQLTEQVITFRNAVWRPAGGSWSLQPEASDVVVQTDGGVPAAREHWVVSLAEFMVAVIALFVVIGGPIALLAWLVSKLPPPPAAVAEWAAEIVAVGRVVLILAAMGSALYLWLRRAMRSSTTPPDERWFELVGSATVVLGGMAVIYAPRVDFGSFSDYASLLVWATALTEGLQLARNALFR